MRKFWFINIWYALPSILAAIIGCMGMSSYGSSTKTTHIMYKTNFYWITQNVFIIFVYDMVTEIVWSKWS